MMRILVVAISLMLGACSMVAPPYQVSIENVQELKKAGIGKIKVGEVVASKKLDKISLRGSKMHSPVNGSYGPYLALAIEEELKLAKLWSGVSNTVISGELLSNDINIAGFSVGTGEISAKFMVTANEKVVYEKVVSADHQFDSSFMGNIAIPNGQSNYVNLVQKLIKNLFSDPEFINAVKM